MIDSQVFSKTQPIPYQQAKSNIQNGDLLFCSGNSPISLAIKQATKSVFSHVALLLLLPVTEQWLVLESVESIGVRCVTLYEGYLTNYLGDGSGYDGQILVARHAAINKQIDHLAMLYQKAFSLIGDRYNQQDIINIATRIALGKIGIDKQGVLQGDNQYICSEYVYACLQAINITMPYDPLGFIAPADIANSPDVSFVTQLAVEK